MVLALAADSTTTRLLSSFGILSSASQASPHEQLWRITIAVLRLFRVGCLAAAEFLERLAPGIQHRPGLAGQTFDFEHGQRGRYSRRRQRQSAHQIGRAARWGRREKTVVA